MVLCRVTLLDGTSFEPKAVDKNSTGANVLEKVCRHLDLVETDYFGLTFRDKSGKKFWLDNSKKISKQVKGGTWVFEFQVKFYPPDPHALKEDITRYQLCLQLRVDIFNGKLPCSFVTYALLGSYTVQAEMGDYSVMDYSDSIDYLKDFDFAPQQPPELLEKIAELHKHHKGQMPAEAEANFLENAKKLAMYGVDKHDAKDSENKDLTLGVCASGILVFKDRLRINRFVWPKILKLSYKRNNFYIKIRPGEFEPHEKVIGFKLLSHKLAKRLWKTCVEHHAFFRLKMGDPPDQSTLFPRFNSKFRYSGRTQAQARKVAENLHREEPHIKRTAERKSMLQADKAKSMDDMANRHNDKGYKDENDMYDKKRGVPTAMTGMGAPPENNSQYPYDDAKYRSAPGPGGDETEDRRDRAPGDGEKTEGMPGYEGDTSGLAAGGVVGKKGKKDKDEEKRRKKEEEKERKRLEKLEKERKKKGGDGATTEDRSDKMGGQPGATETAIEGTGPDSSELAHKTKAGMTWALPGMKELMEKQAATNQAGMGYGVDFAPGDFGMAPGDSKSIDRKMQFIPITPPTSVEVRDRNKSANSVDEPMPFFEPTGESTDESTLGRKKVPPPVAKKPKPGQGFDTEEDRQLRDSPPTVATESYKYNPDTDDLPTATSNIPIVETKTHHVTYEKDGIPTETEDGFLISAHSVTTKTQTIETTTFKTERDGLMETRVERKVTVTSDENDDTDHDALLRSAIEEVTAMNPDLTVERIECMRQIEEVNGDK